MDVEKVLSIGMEGSRLPKLIEELAISNLQSLFETTTAVTETVPVSEAWQKCVRIKIEIAMMNNFFN